MILNMYAVLDTKVGAFSNPWCDQTDNSAIRGFSDAVNDGSNPNNQWHRHPEDFSLYKIGQFDTSIGKIVPVELMECLVTASALAAAKKPEQLNLIN